MPMSTDGEQDMFWRAEWDPIAQASQCLEQFGVSPRDGWAALEYGGYDSWSQSEKTSNGGVSCPARSRTLPCLIPPCPAVSRPLLSSPDLYCHIMSYRAPSRPVLSWLAFFI